MDFFLSIGRNCGLLEDGSADQPSAPCNAPASERDKRERLKAVLAAAASGQNTPKTKLDFSLDDEEDFLDSWRDICPSRSKSHRKKPPRPVAAVTPQPQGGLSSCHTKGDGACCGTRRNLLLEDAQPLDDSESPSQSGRSSSMSSSSSSSSSIRSSRDDDSSPHHDVTCWVEVRDVGIQCGHDPYLKVSEPGFQPQEDDQCVGTSQRLRSNSAEERSRLLLSDDDDIPATDSNHVSLCASSCLQTSSSDDDAFEAFVSRVKTLQLERKETAEQEESGLDSFIVSDSDISSDSPGFHIRVNREQTVDKRCPHERDSDASPHRLSVHTQAEVVCTSGVSPSLSTLTFLASLDEWVLPSDRHPEAAKYFVNLKVSKVELASRLYRLFNEHIFDQKLDLNPPLIWNKRLTKSAGYCRLLRAGSERQRVFRIELSDKVCDSPERIRDTLLHEMCHAAVWVVFGKADEHHGKLWLYWTAKAVRIYPEVPRPSTFHSYYIQAKYTYECIVCFHLVQRHSKSIKVERQMCGSCGGSFRLLKTSSSTTRTPFKASGQWVTKTPSKSSVPSFSDFVRTNRNKLERYSASERSAQFMANYRGLF